MLRSIYIFALITQVLAQRGGGDYGGYGGYGGYRGDYQETPLAHIITQTQVQTQVQTQTQTQVQVQTKTMVSTALSMAPTTVVQVQATTVVKVATISPSSLPATPSIQSPDPSPSPSTADDQSQTPFVESISISQGLTVDASPSASPSPIPSSANSDPGVSDISPSETRPIGAASEVSAPVTRLTGTVPTGKGYMTTGVPNLDDGAQGVVYGHRTANGSGRLAGRASLSWGIGYVLVSVAFTITIA